MRNPAASGAPPAIIHKRDRPRYLKALAYADRGEYGPLAEVFARAVRATVEKHMLPALAGPMRMVPLSALETPELSLVALRSAAKRKRLETIRHGEHYYSCQRWAEAYAKSRHQGKRAA